MISVWLAVKLHFFMKSQHLSIQFIPFLKPGQVRRFAWLWTSYVTWCAFQVFWTRIKDQESFLTQHTLAATAIREGFKKSKWKFKMAFAMKGGGRSRGGLECHIPILKNDFFKNHLESFPDCENVFCT